MDTQREHNLIFLVENSQLTVEDFSFVVDRHVVAVMKYLQLELKSSQKVRPNVKVGMVVHRRASSDSHSPVLERIFLTSSATTVFQALRSLDCQFQPDRNLSLLDGFAACLEMFDERKRLLELEGHSVPVGYFIRHIVFIGGVRRSSFQPPFYNADPRWDALCGDNLATILTREKVSLSFVITRNSPRLLQVFQTAQATDGPIYHCASDRSFVAFFSRINLSQFDERIKIFDDFPKLADESLPGGIGSSRAASKRVESALFSDSAVPAKRAKLVESDTAVESSVNSVASALPSNSVPAGRIVWFGQISVVVNSVELAAVVTAEIQEGKAEADLKTPVWPNKLPLEPCRVDVREFVKIVQSMRIPMAHLRNQQSQIIVNNELNFGEISKLLVRTGLVAVTRIGSNFGLVIFPVNNRLLLAAFVSHPIPAMLLNGMSSGRNPTPHSANTAVQNFQQQSFQNLLNQGTAGSRWSNF